MWNWLLVRKKKGLQLSSKPNFESVKTFDLNLVVIHIKKTQIYFNKTIYVGQAILDLSKTHDQTFEFHYNYINEKYGDHAELLSSHPQTHV